MIIARAQRRRLVRKTASRSIRVRCAAISMRVRSFLPRAIAGIFPNLPAARGRSARFAVRQVPLLRVRIRSRTGSARFVDRAVSMIMRPERPSLLPVPRTAIRRISVPYAVQSKNATRSLRPSMKGRSRRSLPRQTLLILTAPRGSSGTFISTVSAGKAVVTFCIPIIAGL